MPQCLVFANYKWSKLWITQFTWETIWECRKHILVRNIIDTVAKQKCSQGDIPILDNDETLPRFLVLGFSVFRHRRYRCRLLVRKCDLYVIAFSNQRGKWFQLSDNGKCDTVLGILKMTEIKIPRSYTRLESRTKIKKAEICLGFRPFCDAISYFSE